ncbi:MAG: nucleotide exchange factor GrpE [Syntrophorhabdaceae bacterium]|nr:nucleotide exchange factor GrpE [Syntrophorhabdaceae bacterium]
MKEKDKDLLLDEKEEMHEENGGNGHKHEEHKKKKKKEETPAELKKELEEKEGKIKSLEERLLYLQADFENFKKIKAKEKLDVLKYANEVIIKELLPVLDNLELALRHAESTDDHKGIHEGVRMTLSEFMKVLEKAGVKSVEAVGKKFDPNFHEAFYQEEHDDVEPDTVVSELQKGYLLNDRLIRPSRVGVSKKPDIQ